LGSNYFEGYSNTQFLFLIVSLDPWGILRGYRLPDELKLYTNMSGFKKKAGDIEVLLVGDKFSGLFELNDFEYVVVNPIFRDLFLKRDFFPPTGWLKISIEEESSAVVETDPIGFHPAYYIMYGSDLILSVREYWIESLSGTIIEIPNNYKVELSYKSTLMAKKRIQYKSQIELEKTITEGLSLLLEKTNLDKIFIFDSSLIDKFTLRILIENNLFDGVKFLPATREANKLLLETSRESGVEYSDLQIFNLEELGLSKDNSSTKQIIKQIKQYWRKEKINNSAIFLINTIKNDNITDLSGLNTPISYYIEEKKLYKYLRELFSIAWPTAIVDPTLFDGITYLSGREFVEKIM